jgi:hypothetical protein
MPNPAIQRLIAAGASPQRARAFTDQVMKKNAGSTAAPKPGAISVTEIAADKSQLPITKPAQRPMIKPPALGQLQPEGGAVPQSEMVSAMGAGAQPQTSIIKPMGESEWFNEKYQGSVTANLQAKGQPVYRAPDFGTPEFKQYFEFNYGPGEYAKFEQKLYSQYAPDLFKAKTGSTFEQTAAKAIASNISPAIFVQGFYNPKKNKGESDAQFKGRLAALAASGYGKKDDGLKYVEKLQTQYSGLNSNNELKTTIGNYDINWKYSIPTGKFTYGATTDYSKGTINALYNTAVFDQYKKYEKILKDAKLPQAKITQVLNTYLTGTLVPWINKTNSPSTDEKARRDKAAKGDK